MRERSFLSIIDNRSTFFFFFFIFEEEEDAYNPGAITELRSTCQSWVRGRERKRNLVIKINVSTAASFNVKDLVKEKVRGKQRQRDSVSVVGTLFHYVATIFKRVRDLRNRETRSMISMVINQATWHQCYEPRSFQRITSDGIKFVIYLEISL